MAKSKWTIGNLNNVVVSNSYNHAYFVNYLHPDTLKGMLENCQKRFIDHLERKEFNNAFKWFVYKNHINDMYQTILLETFDHIKDTNQTWIINNGSI